MSNVLPPRGAYETHLFECRWTIKPWVAVPQALMVLWCAVGVNKATAEDLESLLQRASKVETVDVRASMRWRWRGYAGCEARLFPSEAARSEQAGQRLSVLAEPEVLAESVDSGTILQGQFFARQTWNPLELDGDIRELNLQSHRGDWSALIGIGRVYWGATESRHLVDIINQSDLCENFEGDVKLGQPMLRLSRLLAWGDIECYVLPTFRERRFQASDARLSTELPLDDHATYPDGRREPDFAGRISLALDHLDLHVFAFHGLNREPILTPVFDEHGAPYALRPIYRRVSQGGLDVQYALGDWLIKGEALARQSSNGSYAAAVSGVEYALLGVGGSATDLSLFAEYQYDGRPQNEWPAPAEHGLFAGFRWAANNTASTELKAGVLQDLQRRARLFKIDLSHRLGKRNSLVIKGYGFDEVDESPSLGEFSRDSYLDIGLRHYF